MRSVLLAIAALALSVGACGDDPVTIVELSVIETIPIDFDDMVGNVAEGAAVSLADLRDEPKYAEVLPALRCGALDITDSFIEVEALEVGAGATVVDYRVEVAPRGGATGWKFLGEFNGSVARGERVSLTDPKFTISAEGLQTIAAVVLSGTPALDVQVVATVPGNIDELQIGLSLSLMFSSDAGGCPSAETGL